MDDDMLPNDGTYYQPTEPQEQVQSRRVEASKAQAAKPMLEELIDKIQDDIDLMNSVGAIRISPETDAINFMKAWYGLQERLGYAQELKDYLESLLITTVS